MGERRGVFNQEFPMGEGAKTGGDEKTVDHSPARQSAVSVRRDTSGIRGLDSDTVALAAAVHARKKHLPLPDRGPSNRSRVPEKLELVGPAPDAARERAVQGAIEGMRKTFPRLPDSDLRPLAEKRLAQLAEQVRNTASHKTNSSAQSTPAPKSVLVRIKNWWRGLKQRWGF